MLSLFVEIGLHVVAFGGSQLFSGDIPSHATLRGLFFGCAAAALLASPLAASAGNGVPNGMAYGFHRGSEIAGPVIGGIPGAIRIVLIPCRIKFRGLWHSA